MTTKLHNIRFGGIVTGIALLLLAAGIFASKAHANPSFFMQANVATSCAPTASTSVVYMTPGTATTTYTFDTGCAAAGSADSAVFAAQFTGSSTASQEAVAFEYSQDNVDWYADRYSAGATTTPTVNLTLPTTYLFNFSSSTVGGIGGTATRTTRLFDVKTPTRYVRAVVTIPVTSGVLNGAVWGEFIAKRQAGN